MIFFSYLDLLLWRGSISQKGLVLFFMLHVFCNVKSKTQNMATQYAKVTDSCSIGIKFNTSHVEDLMGVLSVEEKSIFYIHIDIKSPAMKERNWSRSSLNWIIIDETGHFLLTLPRNYDVITFGLLQRKIGIANLTVFLETENCTSEEFNTFFRKLILNLTQKMKYNNKVYHICRRIFPQDSNNVVLAKFFFITPTWKGYEVECFGMDDQNNTLSKKIREGAYVFTVYWTAYVIIVFSPVLVLLLVNLMDTRNDRFKFYREGDVPYSIDRGIVNLSKALDYFIPNFSASDRSFQKVCFVLWFVNLVVYCVNMWCHVSKKSVELDMDNVEIWAGSVISKEVKLLLFVLIYTIAFVVLIVLMRQCSETEISGAIKKPMVFFLNSSGTCKHASCNLSKKSLHFFVSKVDEDKVQAGSIGRHLLWVQMERFFLLANKEFWYFIFRQSFYILIKLKKSGVCVSVAFFFPCLFFGCLCFIFTLSANLLWGIFPIFGFLFTSLASAKSCCSLLKVILITFLLHFFIQIVFGENLVFVMNVVLVTSLIGVPEASSESFPFLSQVVPILVYTIGYWNQFTKKYKSLLDIISEVKKELRYQQNEDEAGETKDREKEEISVSTREFDIICEFIIPVKEQCIQLLGKMVGTLLFLVIAVTMLLWKRSSNYASVDQLVMFVFVFILPKVVEYCCKDPNESQTSDLKSKVRDLLCKFENGDFVQFDNEEFGKTNSVVCLWKSLCTKRSDKNEREIDITTDKGSCV